MTSAPTMTEAELDAAYTHLCKTMTELGEARAPLFLARFALLAMMRIGDAARGAGPDRCRRGGYRFVAS